MSAVFCAFLVIRKKSGLVEDFASLCFILFVIAGVLGAMIFMGTLLLIVRAVVSHS
jgi:hypothetical protein